LLLIKKCNFREDKEKIIQQFFKYANDNSIILDINGKNDHGDYPLLCSIKNDYYYNYNIFKMITNYTKENNIILKINRKTVMVIIHF